MQDRATGWLDSEMHHRFRELLLHTLSRYDLHCPVYCLMPDHAHMLWMGLGERSDQRLASRFLRRSWNACLKTRSCRLQSQAYDHVLRKNEVEVDGFEEVVMYIFKNPERAGLVTDWQDWPYQGTLMPGYPDFSTNKLSGFWARFWKIYHGETNRRKRMGE